MSRIPNQEQNISSFAMHHKAHQQMPLASPAPLLQITQVTRAKLDHIRASFDRLPHTPHADGQYRLRRYSVLYWYPEKLIESKNHDFIQSKDYNKFQGDVKRHFQGLEKQVIHSEALKEACDIFIQANHFALGQALEIHQMRIVTFAEQTPVAPEGIHQDGFDSVALFGVSRRNIYGGTTQVFADKSLPAMLSKVLEDGDLVILSDHQLWHYASPIVRQDASRDGYMDVMVITANREPSKHPLPTHHS